jgi:hypothetical protein
MILKLHRRQTNELLYVNMDHIISMFDGRYRTESGAVLAHQKGTYEVSESLDEIEAMIRAERGLC